MNRKRKRRRQTRKNIISYLLSFVLMVSLMSLSIISFGNYSMLSIHGVENTCNRTGYYGFMKNELMQTAYDLAIPFGLHDVLKNDVKKDKNKSKGGTGTSTKDAGIVFLDDVFSEDKIKEDVQAVTKAHVNGTQYQIDVETIKTKIFEKAEKKMGTVSKKQKEAIDEYSEQLGEIYKKKMVIPGISYIAEGINVINKVRWYVIPISIFFILLCIFFLISIRNTTHRGLRFIAYSFLGAGGTLTTVFAAMISNGAIYKLNISNAFMRRFFTFYIGHAMLIQIFYGIGMLIAGAVLVAIIIRIKFKGTV